MEAVYTGQCFRTVSDAGQVLEQVSHWGLFQTPSYLLNLLYTFSKERDLTFR